MPPALPAAIRWILPGGLSLCLGILAALILPGRPGEWLSLPLSGTVGHQLVPWIAWHGRLMVLSWGLLLPLGIVIARFFKVLPGQAWPAVLDRKTWWRAHLWLQGGGVAVMSAGVLLILGHSGMPGQLARWHHLAGWTLVSGAALQVLGGLLRGSKGGPTGVCMRGDHYDMSARRVVFEWLHKCIGWTSLPVAVATIGAGLVLADAPRWMPLLLGAWWLMLAALALALQRAGLCIDTYQAIWGPDSRHPGNQRRPIGWGITRPLSPPASPPGVHRPLAWPTENKE
ncbi:cytochrome b561 domain-containing protein [Cupriavidus necator]|uniref:cytochrome b561 domain-containing protein n=1 Tax=Cupriavidus necator TaxID=106590 RepID=UPI00339D59A6